MICVLDPQTVGNPQEWQGASPEYEFAGKLCRGVVDVEVAAIKAGKGRHYAGVGGDLWTAKPPCVPRRGSGSTYTQETLDSQAAQTRHFPAQIADKDCVGEWKKLTTRQTPTVAVLIISPLLHPRQEQRPVVSGVKCRSLHTRSGSSA
ncbi:hypothetical protein E2C01_047110 [Portunus trituberculatus]|uniref:Uncharacterized protein n=1 Tax=Portunus trituberculatus TaxID=210409 RepID=A0A5B7G2R4_PORTR|nr:hypothetical protein [Portunus trituberculatus]